MDWDTIYVEDSFIQGLRDSGVSSVFQGLDRISSAMSSKFLEKGLLLCWAHAVRQVSCVQGHVGGDVKPNSDCGEAPVYLAP